jgi:hypothetical protein
VHSDQYPYRQLHDAMLDWPGARFPGSHLADWLRGNPDEVRWLHAFGASRGPESPATSEELWRLYALSRVIELMNLSFQSGDAGWAGPGIPLHEVSSFATDLGLSVSRPERYSAFDCEIVNATSAQDPEQPIMLEGVNWPCVMLGDMLVCRAGATVRGGAAFIDPQIAMSSTLYWAYRRRYRLYQDLSHGWGSNSQWRTSFRRDYRIGARHFYNVDGTNELADPDLRTDDDSPLSRSERTELLLNRCFVVTTKPSDDLWPYDDRLTNEL